MTSNLKQIVHIVNIMSKKCNMSVFIAYYNSLKPKEQKALRKELKTECKLSRSSIYKYINNERTPAYGTQVLISGVVGIEQGKLFPKHE